MKEDFDEDIKSKLSMEPFFKVFKGGIHLSLRFQLIFNDIRTTQRTSQSHCGNDIADQL